jgi:hypothetical protein
MLQFQWIIHLSIYLDQNSHYKDTDCFTHDSDDNYTGMKAQFTSRLKGNASIILDEASQL